MIKDFAYTSEGEVVLFGNKGEPPLLNGKFNYPEDVPWGVTDKYYYSVIDGILTPMTPEEKQAYDIQAEKHQAYKDMEQGIADRKYKENYKPFPYQGNTYKSEEKDRENIEGVQNVCLSLLSSDPIPTFPMTPDKSGTWWVMENTQVPFTCGEFLIFAKAYADRFSWNYDNSVVHRTNIYGLYIDPSKTAQDVLDYDYSTGWQ